MDRELEEALDTVVGDASTIRETVTAFAKARLSGRPSELAEPNAREWLRTPAARDLAKRGTMALVLDDDVDPIRAEACASYAQTSGDAAWWGGMLFDHVVGFLALTLDSAISAGDRLNVQVTNVRADRLETQLADVRGDLARQPELLRAVVEGAVGAGGADLAAELLGSLVEREHRRLAIDDPARLDRVIAAATRTKDGDLRRASPAAAIGMFRLAARLLARAGRVDEADEWLAAARAAGATDLATDEARVAIQRKDWTTAFRLLGTGGERAANSLLLEALHGRDGAEAGLKYQAAHLPADRLGGFMLPVVAAWLLEADRGADAEAILVAADEEHVRENPVLPFARARLRLALMASGGIRVDLFPNTAAFPQPETVHDDAEGVRLRAAALDDLREAALAAAALGDPGLIGAVEANRLFLSLGSTDPAISDTARDQVVALAADPATALDRAWLALAYDLPFDERHLRAELERASLLGGLDGGSLMTAIQLAMRSSDRNDLLSLLETNRERLAGSLPVELSHGLEIEALARTGRIADARRRLDAAREPLGPELAARLSSIIDEQEGANPVAMRIAAYEASGSDADLTFLVKTLREQRDLRTPDYATKLWRATRRSDDALLALDALFDQGRDEELDAFLNEIDGEVPDGPRLFEHRAWALYRAGRLDEARRELDPLRAAAPDRASLRQLAINLGVESGDMARLAALATEDFERRHQRNAEQLLQAAGLAHAAGGGPADELARAAVASAPDDPNVLLAAFTLATRRGRDWEPEASEWLRRAMELSDDAGPVQQADLREVIASQEERARGLADLNRMVMDGRVPLSIAARTLGTSLSELILGRLAANVLLPARERLCLPLVAGDREPIDLTSSSRIGLDPSALLALQLCGLLETTLERLPGVVIPAGTLPLLLHDLERLHRPQQSRIDQANAIKALIDDGRIAAFDPPVDADPIQARYDRAAAIGGRMVHGSPIWEPGSLGERHRDPTTLADRLASLQSLADALVARGELDADEGDRACEKLAGYGARWPDEPDVDLDAPLVVDTLALSGLAYASLLDRLAQGGTRLEAPRQAVDQIRREIDEWHRAKAVERAITAVRGHVALALATQKARMGPFRRSRSSDASGEPGLPVETTPLVSLLRDGSVIDVLVSGDRGVNGHSVFTDAAGIARPVATPLDVIDRLVADGAITSNRRAEARRALREAGVAFVPLEVAEIVAAAKEGNWSRGPGRSLRAIRDAIHLIMARGAAAMPTDRKWLADTSTALSLSVRRCWRELATPALAEAAASFLVEITPAASAWVAEDPSPDAQEWAASVTLAAHALLALPADVPRDRLDDYHAWYDRFATLRLDGRDRATERPLLDLARSYILSRSDDLDVAGVVVPATAVRRMVAGFVPDRLKRTLLSDPDVAAAVGGTVSTLTLAGHDVEFQEMARFFAEAADGQPADLVDAAGAIVASDAKIENGILTATVADGRGTFLEAGVFASTPAARLTAFDRLLGLRTLAPSLIAFWRERLQSGPPDPATLSAFLAALDATPEAYLARVRAMAEFRCEELVPDEGTPYRNMLDPAGGDGTLPGILRALAAGHAHQPWTAAAIRSLAPVAISPDLPLAAMAAGLADEELARLALALARSGDPFSKVAAFELASGRSGSQACRNAATRTLEMILGADAPLGAAITLFCATGVFALAKADVRAPTADLPLAVRRCAALAQAGLMCRAMKDLEIDAQALQADGLSWAGARWGIADLLDRFEAPAWPRLWLQPAVLGPYALRRLRRAAEAEPADSRPPQWAVLLDAEEARLAAAGLEAGLTMPGPLDEFGDALPVKASDGTRQLLSMMLVSAEEAEPILFLFMWAHRPPDDPADFENAVEELFHRAPDDQRRAIAELGLAVAGRWRLSGLADRLTDLVRVEANSWGMQLMRQVELSFAAASAQAPGTQYEALAERLAPLAFEPMDRDQARAFAGLLDVLQDLRPEHADRFERLRSVCLLAS